MTDCRKAFGLSQSSLTLVWQTMLLDCTKSNHARASCVFRLFCSSSVSPNMCLCRCHGRALQQPRLKLSPRSHHFQRQWVSLSGPETLTLTLTVTLTLTRRCNLPRRFQRRFQLLLPLQRRSQQPLRPQPRFLRQFRRHIASRWTDTFLPSTLCLGVRISLGRLCGSSTTMNESAQFCFPNPNPNPNPNSNCQLFWPRNLNRLCEQRHLWLCSEIFYTDGSKEGGLEFQRK